MDLGHKHIGFITGVPGYYTSMKQLSGYKRCLTDASIDWRDQIVETGDWTFLGGYNAMRKMLGEKPERRTTALFAANDMTAMGAMEAIKAAGLSVPQDISLVGYNDIEQCKYSNPTLTTTKTDYPLLAKVTLQILMDQVESGEVDHFRIEIPTELIVRESAAATADG